MKAALCVIGIAEAGESATADETDGEIPLKFLAFGESNEVVPIKSPRRTSCATSRRGAVDTAGGGFDADDAAALTLS